MRSRWVVRKGFPAFYLLLLYLAYAVALTALQSCEARATRIAADGLFWRRKTSQDLEGLPQYHVSNS